jgi:hypothetical protein
MKYSSEMRVYISKAVDIALKSVPDEKLKCFSWFSIKEEISLRKKKD